MKKVLLMMGLLVCALMLLVFQRNAMAEEGLDLRKLKSLAKKLEAPITSRDEIAEKQTTDEFAALTPKEVFELRKIHRKIYWPRYARKMNKKQVFDTMEKIDRILFQMIEEKFGPEATLHNLSDDRISWVMDEVMKLEEVKQLTADLENGLNSGKGCKRCSEEQSQSKIGTLLASCDYVSDWPNFLPYIRRNAPVYRGYYCDRVKNDPNEWPCDFRLHVTPQDYKEVDGYSLAGRCTANFHGGLNASGNKDRLIIGYFSVLFCGNPPFEWWVKQSIGVRK